MDIIKQINDLKVNDSLSIMDVVNNPADYPADFCSAVLDVIKEMSSQLNDSRDKIKNRIIKEMREDDATKLHFRSNSGRSKVITKNPGKRDCKLKSDQVEQTIEDKGFDPHQLGSYEYKLKSWSKLKEVRKQGGDIKDLIDSLYVQGDDWLKISDGKE